jgi:hypothetical protein
VVKFFENFSIHYFDSLGQDPMVGFQKELKNSTLQFALKMLVLEWSFLKHSKEISEV